jgi:hypothetical protein
MNASRCRTNGSTPRIRRYADRSHGADLWFTEISFQACGARDLRVQAGVERAADEIEMVEGRGRSLLEQGDELVTIALAPGLWVEAKDGAHRAGLRFVAGTAAGALRASAASCASRVSAPRAVGMRSAEQACHDLDQGVSLGRQS